MEDKIKQLDKAKDSVKYLLDNPNSSVDFHDIVYWAGVVQRLREEIKKSL